MDEQDRTYPYGEILFGNKKEWNTDMCYNVDEPWKRCGKWRKPDTKGHVLYESVYLKYPE